MWKSANFGMPYCPRILTKNIEIPGLFSPWVFPDAGNPDKASSSVRGGTFPVKFGSNLKPYKMIFCTEYQPQLNPSPSTGMQKIHKGFLNIGLHLKMNNNSMCINTMYTINMLLFSLIHNNIHAVYHINMLIYMGRQPIIFCRVQHDPN